VSIKLQAYRGLPMEEVAQSELSCNDHDKRLFLIGLPANSE